VKPNTVKRLLCGAYLDELHAGRRIGNRKAVRAKTFNVKLDSFLDEFENLITGFRDGHTAWQVGNMRPETGFTLLDHDSVFHSLILFQTCLFENRVERTGRHIDICFSGNGHSTALGWMFELPVASLRAIQVPAIVMEQLDKVADLHAGKMYAFSD
jgi:hypothetical protein